MKKISLLTFFIIITVGNLYSQNLFPEKFDDCNTERFALESDSTTAKTQDSKLIEVLEKGINYKTNKEIKGILTLQIIVGLDGNSCLLSFKNDLNVSNIGPSLKKEVDKNLNWEKPTERVAAIVSFRVQNGNIEFKRLGMNAQRGVHELKN